MLQEADLDCAFDLYKTYLDVTSSNSFVDAKENDFDLHLFRIIALLLPQTNPCTVPVHQLIGTKQELAAVLISVVSCIQAEKAIAKYMENPLQNEKLLHVTEEYTTQCLTFFPSNAAGWVLGANFARISQRLPAHQIAAWYDHAAQCALNVRSVAIQLYDTTTTKFNQGNQEWIERLLLNAVTGVERMTSRNGSVALDVSTTKIQTNPNMCLQSDQQDLLNEDEDGKEAANMKKNETEENSSFGETEEWSSSPVEATARFMGAMLPSIAGDHATALVALRRFPITHRLSTAMWSGQNETAQQGDHLKSDPSTYCREGGLLPGILYRSLCRVFASDAAFWRETQKQKKGYFSFYMDLPKGEHPAKNLIEDVVLNYLWPLSKRQLSEEDAVKICGYEWWVVSTANDDDLGTNLHFEHDYALVDLYKKNVHPLLSSILYLSGNEGKSGTTVLLDQKADSTETAEFGWRSEHHDNSLLVFQGDLMRGIMPKNPQQASPINDTLIIDTGTQQDNTDDIVHNVPEILLTTTTITKSQLLNMADLWRVPSDSLSLTHALNDDALTLSQKQLKKSNSTLTFMVAFWGQRVPDSFEYPPTLYSPCGPLPPDTKEHSWVSEIKAGYEFALTDGRDMKCPTQDIKRKNYCTHEQEEPIKSTKLQRIGPAWEDIYSETCSSVASAVTSETDGHDLNVPKGFQNRFFLQTKEPMEGSLVREDEESTSK